MSAACASRYDRWYRLHADPSLVAWTACIDDRSGRWAAHFTGLRRHETLEGLRTSDQAFANVLGGCADRLHHPTWESLSPERRRRLTQAARWRFDSLETAALAQVTEGII